MPNTSKDKEVELSSLETHHRVNIDGFKMYYVTAGKGPPLVLLHGFPETHYAWRKIIPALAAHFQVVAPDLPGFGDSDRNCVSYDKKTIAKYIHQLVKHLDLGPINLVGHDVGMMVAYAYAAAYPTETLRLVLMEAALPGLGLEELYDAIKYPAMYHLPLFDAPNGLAEALISGKEKMFVAHFMRQQSYDPNALDETALSEYARRLSAPGALRSGIEYFRAHKEDAQQNLEYSKIKLRMPVLTIGGTASFGAHLAGQIQPLVEQIESIMVDQCGHYLAEEKPSQIIDYLLEFFASSKQEDSPLKMGGGMVTQSRTDFHSRAVIRDRTISNSDIQILELTRARHALSYLKNKLGNENIRELLKSDTEKMTEQVLKWVDSSNGAWQTDSVELVVPGPSAKDFHEWYVRAIGDDIHEGLLRSGHPEHFMSHPQAPGIEVIENIAETDLPWHILYRGLSEEGALPMPWEADYPIHFGAEILDMDGVRIGYTMHQLCDKKDGLHLKLTTHLPAAAPRFFARRHLNHFMIEFSNWTYEASVQHADRIAQAG